MYEVHYIRKEGGKVKAASLRATLDSLPDGPYRITIEDDGGKRTSGQNDYLHAILRIYAKAINEMQAHGPRVQYMTMEDLKEWALSKFAPEKDILLPGGEVQQVRKRSHEMTSEELTTFADTLAAYMWETYNITTAKPNEQLEL